MFEVQFYSTGENIRVGIGPQSQLSDREQVVIVKSESFKRLVEIILQSCILTGLMNSHQRRTCQTRSMDAFSLQKQQVLERRKTTQNPTRMRSTCSSYLENSRNKGYSMEIFSSGMQAIQMVTRSRMKSKENPPIIAGVPIPSNAFQFHSEKSGRKDEPKKRDEDSKNLSNLLSELKIGISAIQNDSLLSDESSSLLTVLPTWDSSTTESSCDSSDNETSSYFHNLQLPRAKNSKKKIKSNPAVSKTENNTYSENGDARGIENSSKGRIKAHETEFLSSGFELEKNTRTTGHAMVLSATEKGETGDQQNEIPPSLKTERILIFRRRKHALASNKHLAEDCIKASKTHHKTCIHEQNARFAKTETGLPKTSLGQFRSVADVKRKRGRPRKHERPLENLNNNKKLDSEELDTLLKAKWPLDEILQDLRTKQSKSKGVDWNRLHRQENIWDPIVFHEENELETLGHEHISIDPIEGLWFDMDLASHKLNPSTTIQNKESFEEDQEELDILKDLVEDENEDEDEDEKVDSIVKTDRRIDPYHCKHEFLMNDEVGIICHNCGLINESIENLYPPMIPFFTTKHFRAKEFRNWNIGEEKDMDNSSENEAECVMYSKNTDPCKGFPTEKKNWSVWSLIPDLEKVMHSHQKDGFEFLWRNIVGGITPSEITYHRVKHIGGCILSHPPGTGKSLLIISFLQSYLQLNLDCRVLIVAPTSMLHQWKREFQKWHVAIPVFVLNINIEDNRGKNKCNETDKQDDELHESDKDDHESLESPNCPSLTLRRIQTIFKWYHKQSVMLISYRLFSYMADERTGASEIEKKISRLLLETPDLLILDEGHFPRNQKTKVRRAIMRIKTQSRILLSGTLFQNNFLELFNILYLVRPRFMDEFFNIVEQEKPKFNSLCGPKWKIFKNERAKGTRHSSRWLKGSESECIQELKRRESMERNESRDRKLFMETIGHRIQGMVTSNTRECALQDLKYMTSSFVHCSSGNILNGLPGIKDFTIFLKPSDLQESVLDEIAKRWDSQQILDRDHLVSCICVHPYFIKRPHLAEKYQNIDIPGLEESKFDYRQGVKAKFAIEIVKICSLVNEKVLIFSQYLGTLKLLEDLFEYSLNFHREIQIMTLCGNLNVNARQEIIDRFNQPEDKAHVLLASIKACGEGISLTGASRVIFLDIVWNPAVVKQAVSRSFRLGQQKVVYVYRLVASGTTEGNKYRKNRWKDWLSRSIFVAPHGENIATTGMVSPHILPQQCPTDESHMLESEDKVLHSIFKSARNEGEILRICKHDRFVDQLETQNTIDTCVDWWAGDDEDDDNLEFLDPESVTSERQCKDIERHG